MKKITLAISLAMFVLAGTAAAQVCEYKKGESKFVDYANCRYGEESVVVVELPEGSGWDQCIYHQQPFRPAELLAVTKDKGGKEEISINDRTQIGNPCYMTKRLCDAALKNQ